ncbi:sensor histidine kinase [Nonomuraea sp. NPDC050547]|uniref:sensor histidine kinase n=1 Tax=Nonomuraea sp. NPDC050547 TaxID=3364368 RepID=UPI0037BAE86C
MRPDRFVRLVSRATATDLRDRWLFPALGAAGLVVSVVFGLLAGPVDGRRTAGTLGLVALALGWLSLSAWLLPNRAAYPRLVLVFYAGLLAIGTLLVIRSPAFFAFSWIGYLYAFAMFAAHWILVAVSVTAISQYATLLTVGVPDDVLVYILPIGIFVPVAVAGWIATVEDGRKQHANLALAEANRRLESALAENAGLQDLLLVQAHEAGQLEERQRLAGEIHDTLAQGLTGIVTHVRAVRQSAGEPERWRFHLDRVESLATGSLTEARRSVLALRPGQLESSHLPEAVSSMARRWSESHEVPITVEVTGDTVPLRTAIEITLFRAAQEALTNVAKHARATRVGLTLSYLGEVVLLDVRDDGVGFDPGAVRQPGFGLEAMRRRLHAVGGDLEVESMTGDGTAISVSVPQTAVEDRP